MKTNWNKNGSSYIMGDSTSNVPFLDKGIYTLEFDNRIGLYITRVSDEFTFPYKIYGANEDFVNRIITTFNNIPGNLGVLLSGVKGTGKTITTELIANALNLPVIIINKNYEEALINFINKINQDVVIVIDEYEKIFEKSRHLLSLMDGVYNSSDYRKVFLLSTNNTHIEENLLQRPSRIRYHKKFSDLSLKIIEEIIDDLLIYTDLREDVIETCLRMSIVTIDIVKAIVNEVNLYNKLASELVEDMNLTFKSPDGIEVYYKDVLIYSSQHDYAVDAILNAKVGNPFKIAERFLGTIKKIDLEKGEYEILLDFNRPKIGVKEYDDLLDIPEKELKFKPFLEYYDSIEETEDLYITLRVSFIEKMRYSYAF